MSGTRKDCYPLVCLTSILQRLHFLPSCIIRLASPYTSLITPHTTLGYHNDIEHQSSLLTFWPYCNRILLLAQYPISSSPQMVHSCAFSLLRFKRCTGGSRNTGVKWAIANGEHAFDMVACNRKTKWVNRAASLPIDLAHLSRWIYCSSGQCI